MPSGVALTIDPEEVVALTQEVVEEKEEVVAPADMDSIEVEKKSKEEEPAEGAVAPESGEKAE